MMYLRAIELLKCVTFLRSVPFELESENEIVQSCPTFCDPMDRVAHQALLSMEFSRWEYWSWFPYPPSGVFLSQGSNLCLLHLLHWQVDSLPLSHLRISL